MSPLGCGAALALVIVLGATLVVRGGGPFSPGALSAAHPRGTPEGGVASHAEFEEQCERCHEPWLGTTAARCESCHRAVAAERLAGSGLHGRLVDAARCTLCHSDHQGRTADITALALADFDHAQATAFSLARHAADFDGGPLECGDCHRGAGYAADRIDCVECHTAGDPAFLAEHRGQFGDVCLECHDGRDSMIGFDHAQVFPLDGAHATAACSACHAGRVFAGRPDTCVDCHAEPAIHAGLFGLDCERCHSATAWQPAQLIRHTFPLDHGGEGKIACETCHTETYVAYTCYNCHAHPVEAVRAKHLDEGIAEFEACVECHPTGREDEAEENEEGSRIWRQPIALLP